MIEQEIESLLQPVVESLGYILWGCEYLPQGKHALLRLYIDKAEGINIDDCVLVSRQIAATLDVEDPIKAQYSMEVSSPGIPRPLFKPSHYNLYRNQPIQMKLYKPINGQRKWMGTISDVFDEYIVLSVDNQMIEIPFSNIVKAHLTAE